MEKLGTRTVAFGEPWEVPDGSSGPIILKAKLKLNPLGRLMCMLYKVYPPTICIQYRDGSVSKHCLVWQNVESGFLVSSLPRDLNGVRQFLDNGQADPVRDRDPQRRLAVREGLPAILVPSFDESRHSESRYSGSGRLDNIQANGSEVGDAAFVVAVRSKRGKRGGPVRRAFFLG